MSAPTGVSTTFELSGDDDVVRRLARLALTVAVRGRRDCGRPWGEAALAEFGQTRGRWEALRWSAGGIRAALRERRRQRRELPRWVRIRRRAIAVIVIGVLTGAGIQRWVLTPMYEPSTSMEPTLQAADYWLMDRISFRITGLHYGDVVAYEQTDHGRTPFTVVRRVIGLPGDVISCRDGQVLRNGTALPDPYGSAEPVRPPTACVPLTVPAGAVHLLGDNRGVAADGNPVALDRVEGRLLARLWNAGQDGSWWAPEAASTDAG